jgi:hypothetical protein
MNERIQELWKRAGGHYNRGNQHTWPEYTIDDPKKFAELIVRECVTVMYDDAIERKVPPDINQTPTHYAVAVLEHFGVEE